MSINIEEAKNILFKYYKEQLKKLIDNNFSITDINFLKVKLRHSFDCYYIGREILKEDINFKNMPISFKEKTEIVFLLHDIGRFFELTNELDSKSHGEYGSDILRNDNNIDDELILIPIKHHDQANIMLDNDVNFLKLNDNDKEQTLKILKILKDVDKISNLYLFKIKNTVYTRKDKRYGFCNKYFEGIKNKHLIDKKYKNTIFDSIAYYIIWFYELFYDGSKKFVIDHKLIDHLLDMYEFFINEIEKIELNYNSKENVIKEKNKMIENFIKIKNILKKQKIIE